MQLGHENLSKGIGNSGNHLEAEKWKADNAVNREGSLDFTSMKDISDESILGDKPGTYGHSDVEDSTKGNQNREYKVAPCPLPLHQLEMVEKETEFYLDRAVAEIELPKMIVCYKERSYHIIKDICVDDGLHSFDSILVKNAVKDEKVYDRSTFDRDVFNNEPHNSDSLKASNINRKPVCDVFNEKNEHTSLESLPEACGAMSHTINEIVSSGTYEKNFDEILFPPQPQEPGKHQRQRQITDALNENAKQRSLASLLEEDRNNTHTVEETVCASETELLRALELDKRKPHVDLSSSESNIDHPESANSDIDQSQSVNSDSEESQSAKGDSHELQFIGGDSANSVSITGSTAQPSSVCDSNSGDQSDEGALEEANSTMSVVSSEELNSDNKAKDLHDIGNSARNIIAFEVDADPPAATSEMDSKGMSEDQLSGLVMSSGTLEGPPTGGPIALSWTSFNHGHAATNIIAFDVDSDPPAATSEMDSKGMPEGQLSGLVMSSGTLESPPTGGSIALSRTSFNHGHADSNMLGSASLSGRIVYSGHIPYSGSISLRSDSSTTSTRSFAFPILQSEWNTSPVKMAKADRRHLRRQRSWRSGLLCCRF